MKVILALYVLAVVAALALIVGWWMNIVQVVKLVTHNAPLGTLLIAKIIGIFAAPLGGILGYF